MPVDMRMYSSLDVAAPIHVAYAAWTQFSHFPEFIPDIQRVQPLENDLVRFIAANDSWDVRCTEHFPPSLYSWSDVSGHFTGTVRLYERLDGSTKVVLELSSERLGDPRSILARYGEWLTRTNDANEAVPKMTA